MRYLVRLVNDDLTDDQIERVYREFNSITVSLAYHDETVISPCVMERLRRIGYAVALDWQEISDEQAMAWIEAHRHTPM